VADMAFSRTKFAVFSTRTLRRRIGRTLRSFRRFTAETVSSVTLLQKGLCTAKHAKSAKISKYQAHKSLSFWKRTLKNFFVSFVVKKVFAVDSSVCSVYKKGILSSNLEKTIVW
jgi:type VI protein secretion system component Hcp